MTDDKTPKKSETQPTVPLPARSDTQPTEQLPGSAEPASASAPPASVATAAPAKSPWPVLLPVLVGVGALLLGGILGGAAGFAVGNRFDRGPVVFQMPGGPGNDGDSGPQSAPNASDGNIKRGAIVSGTITELSDGELTLELSNGETVTIAVEDDTPVVEANESSVDELATGDEITVVVRRDGDGDPEARLIRSGDADLSSLGGERDD